MTYPDITVAPANGWLWLWLIIPALLAVVALLLESPMERFTEKRFGKPVVGVGYVLMGIFLFVSAMSIALVPDAIYAQRNTDARIALEEVGFSEVRVNIDNKTFGAIYENELMRGVLVEETGEPGVFKIVDTSPGS